ncbi:hypothetical protein SAMN05880593_1209 [Rhizobium sp. RU36D]|nr:hypothetical protein SAMN05880593_1209 [Rhizobium sp. RU36D]
MVRTVDTLGKAAYHNLLVVAECRQCGRRAKFLAEDLARYYYSDRKIRSLPFKCRECDAMDCKISLTEYLNDRTREVVVWRPMKIR